ncbi:hypothetical protein BHE74_00014667 [Ensete ventricosum]|nr:hypothetical protein BHE74_00014667 [Ensete ventricosum]
MSSMSRLSNVGTGSPWVRLRARLLVVGTDSPWARLRARLLVSLAPHYSAAFSYSACFFSAVAAVSSSSPVLAMLIVSTFIPSLFHPMVSRAGRMSSISSHFESRSVEILTRRSRVLSHPSGDSMSVAIVPLSSAMGDSETANTLATIRSYFNIDSTMITRRLVEVRKNYFIPPEYELYVPPPRECPYDAFPCGFSLSTDALEAGLRFQLHHVIEACLK